MNEMQQLASWCLEFISKHPEHSKAVNAYFVLCKDEVENGESEFNEIHLCKNSINELLN